MSLLRSLGKRPAGPRLQRILRSSHYRDGSFQNPVPTDVTLKDTTIWKMLREYRHKPADSTPSNPIPSIRTDLNSLPANQATVVWFGHSSYLLKLGRTHILVDPVFSGNASPFTFFAKAYPGADIYKPADMPSTLEAILLTHDHYDHLDYKTILELAPRTSHFYTSLGVGAHLEFWGIPAKKITELDWGETVHIDSAGHPITANNPISATNSISVNSPVSVDNPVCANHPIADSSDPAGLPNGGGISSTAGDPSIRLTATPARHFSGRTFKRGQAAWSSFVLNTPNPSFGANPTSAAITSAANTSAANSPTTNPSALLTQPSGATPGAAAATKPRLNLFLGGDSGYGPHFQSIGDQFGPFDLAFLECGQYGVHWPYIHMFPEETVLAARDLNTRILFPVHWAKFTLSLHPWNEPIRRVVAEAKEIGLDVTTPSIGEPVTINRNYPLDPWYNFL